MGGRGVGWKGHTRQLEGSYAGTEPEYVAAVAAVAAEATEGHSLRAWGVVIFVIWTSRGMGMDYRSGGGRWSRALRAMD
jgi:hypothetical protein